MGNDIAAYDYCSFILLLVVAIYYYRTSVHGTYRVRLLRLIVIITFTASVFDATRVRFASIDSVSTFRFINVNTIYLLLLSFITPIFVIFIGVATDTWHMLRVHKLFAFLCFAPFVFNLVILVTNYFYPVVFEVRSDKQLIYHWGYYALYLVFVFYIILSVVYNRKFVRPFDRRKYRLLVGPVYLVAAGVLMNFLVRRHHVICFSLSICILILVLISQRVEDSVDFVTGMHTYKVFADDMDIKFKTGKQMEIILLNILNYRYALRIVGYDAMLQMMTPVSSEILRIMRRYHAQFMCYYNGNGKFAIELSRKHFSYAHDIADEITRSIRQNIRLEISDFELEINTCLAKCPDDISDVEALFMLIADLDIAKTDGRVVSASSITDTKEFTMKKDMTMIIDRAFANHYFSVFYQPIFDVKEGKFTSAEALVRLRDPSYGYISPAIFIPLAEKSGAIHAIGSFVLEEVIRFIASDDFKNLGVNYIEINLSAMQCLRSDLADEIMALCVKYNVSPSSINLEITETASAYSQSKLYSNIQKLSEMGFSFSLDDFGTGYSNLMRIAKLPLDIVKLDRVFVQMEEGGDHHVIIRNVINMIRDMKMKVLVEGVETQEMADSFIDMEVDEIQGFFYSKPLTKTDYIRFVKAANF